MILWIYLLCSWRVAVWMIFINGRSYVFGWFNPYFYILISKWMGFKIPLILLNLLIYCILVWDFEGTSIVLGNSRMVLPFVWPVWGFMIWVQKLLWLLAINLRFILALGVRRDLFLQVISDQVCNVRNLPFNHLSNLRFDKFPFLSLRYIRLLFVRSFSFSEFSNFWSFTFILVVGLPTSLVMTAHSALASSRIKILFKRFIRQGLCRLDAYL